MTAGLIAIRKKFRTQIGIEIKPVFIGTMDIGVAIDTIKTGSQSAVGRSMPGRDAMTLITDTIARLP